MKISKILLRGLCNRKLDYLCDTDNSADDLDFVKPIHRTLSA